MIPMFPQSSFFHSSTLLRRSCFRSTRTSLLSYCHTYTTRQRHTVSYRNNKMAVGSDPAQSETMTQNGSNTPDATANKKPPVVCVFCGASPGTSPSHLEAARQLAKAFHEAGINLVYGGGTTGVMGEIAKTLVSLSGPESVHGVIPQALLEFERDGDKNNATGIDENIYGRTTVVKDMHTRKQLMAREVIESGVGGGFVALSGGYGTMEELMEVVTWNQLGIHARGVVIYNVEGYYDGLLTWVKNAVTSGFVSQGNSGIMVEARTGEEVVEKLTGYRNAEGRFKLKWGEN